MKEASKRDEKRLQTHRLQRANEKQNNSSALSGRDPQSKFKIEVQIMQ